MFDEITGTYEINMEKDFAKFSKYLKLQEVAKGIKCDSKMRKNISEFVEELIKSFLQREILFNYKELEYLLELWIYAPYVNEDLIKELIKSF